MKIFRGKIVERRSQDERSIPKFVAARSILSLLGSSPAQSTDKSSTQNHRDPGRAKITEMALLTY